MSDGYSEWCPGCGQSYGTASQLDYVTEERDELRSELATVTSERDFLVERFRELAEEFESQAAGWREQAVRAPGGATPATARFATWSAAAAKVRQIVTEATTGHNVTATEGEQDGT